MRETIRGYRRKVQLIENQATEKVGTLFNMPTLDQVKFNELNKQLFKDIMPELREAFAEGVKFGRYIKTKLPKRD